jgi:hypothetical protein
MGWVVEEEIAKYVLENRVRREDDWCACTSLCSFGNYES